VGAAGLFLIEPAERKPVPRYDKVRVRVAKLPEKPKRMEIQPPVEEEKKPAPELEAKPPKEPKTKPKKKPKKEIIREKKQVVTKVQNRSPEAPPPATVKQPAGDPASTLTTTQPQKVRKFTVALEATVPGGGVAVPTSQSGGGWAFGSPDGDPEGKRELSKTAPPAGAPDGEAKPVKVSEVTVLPRLLSQPSAAEMRAAYPRKAREDGVEANVVLKILVSAEGQVVRIRVVRGAGDEFDEAARKLVNSFRFRPGERGGRPVAVWIPWTYKFRLES
jgi:protein TonB